MTVARSAVRTTAYVPARLCARPYGLSALATVRGSEDDSPGLLDGEVPVATELLLLPECELRRDGVRVDVARTAERLIAYLGVADRPVERSHAAGALWLDATDAHAAGSLRSALWRLHNAGNGVVLAEGARLSLAPHVRVDLRAGIELARRLLSGRPASVYAAWISELNCDLLPEWYADDWLVLPREQWRQQRLHALELLARRLADQGEFSAAVTAAHAVVRGEPLRESGHRCLAYVHLAEGNVGEALDSFRRFRRLVNHELGVEPSRHFAQLLSRVTRSATYARSG